MARADINDLMAFLAVARERSFTRAAAKLGVSQSALSHTMRRLEARMGIRLLTRSTRSVSPTEAGERLLARLRPALDNVGQAVEEVNAFRDKPMGTLRIVMGRAIATTVFAPMVAPFLAAYPEITLEAVSDDMRLDLVANRFDAGLRIGELIERDMIAVKLIDRIRLACVASPAYLKGREVPQVPADLMQHECIRHRWKFDEAIRPWEFEKDGERVEIEPQGRLIVNEAQNVVTAAASGVGVGYLPLGMVARFILEKRLVQLLPDWSTAYSGLYIYYPSRRQTPAPLQAFIDFARKATSQRSADMQAYDLSVGA